VQRFSLVLEHFGAFRITQADLQALSNSLGTAVEEIHLQGLYSGYSPSGTTLDTSFWPALRTCFPALKKLTLAKISTQSSNSNSTQLAGNMLMAAQASPAPITFSLAPKMWEEPGGREQLQQVLSTWGLNHVHLE
jgi:hypothetical protein